MDEIYKFLFDAMVTYVRGASEVAPTTINLWFDQLSLYDIDTREGYAYFYAPSEFCKTIVIEQYGEYMNDFLTESLRVPIEVKIDIMPKEIKENYENSLRDKQPVEELTEKSIEQRSKEIEEPDKEEDDKEKTVEEFNDLNTYLTDDPKKRKILEKYTFDNFVEGDSNKFAKAACYAVAREPNTYNPLFIYGNSGLGKTHLLYSVINHIKQNDPFTKIVYKKCETFLDELITALNDGDTASFKERYRTCDVLLIDDIQFLAGKEQTQEEFFHTFSALYEADKQIILASDRPPREIKPLEDRLRSRFEGGLLADLQPPNYELRVAIIKKKAEFAGINLTPDLIDYIAQRIRSNIRQIEGVIKKLYAIYSLTSAQITKEEIDRAISIIDPENVPVETMIEKILSQVSKHYGISIADLKSKRKTEDIANARHVAAYLIKEITPLTLKEIGAVFDRDYSTIISSINKVDLNKKTINGYEEEIDKLLKQIKS